MLLSAFFFLIYPQFLILWRILHEVEADACLEVKSVADFVRVLVVEPTLRLVLVPTNAAAAVLRIKNVLVADSFWARHVVDVFLLHA